MKNNLFKVLVVAALVAASAVNATDVEYTVAQIKALQKEAGENKKATNNAELKPVTDAIEVVVEAFITAARAADNKFDLDGAAKDVKAKFDEASVTALATARKTASLNGHYGFMSRVKNTVSSPRLAWAAYGKKGRAAMIIAPIATIATAICIAMAAKARNANQEEVVEVEEVA